MACGGGGATGPSGTPRTALLAIARSDTFAIAPVVLNVPNGRLTRDTLKFTDSTGTLFALITFTPFSILSVDGHVVGDTTIAVTVSVQAGQYFFSVGPSGIRFDVANQPSITLSYARYGSLAVFDSSTRYADTTAFKTALELWHERRAGAWYLASGSGPGPGAGQVSAALEGPGNYLVAALK